MPGPIPILVMLAIAGMFAVAVGVPLGAAAGWAVLGVVVVAILASALTAPVISVDDQELRAGPATLPRRVIASAQALDADAARDARGVAADARQFELWRLWASKRAVRVLLDDPLDPHPSWVMSSRHPQRLVSALQWPHAREGAPDE